MRPLLSLVLGLVWASWHWHIAHAQSTAIEMFKVSFLERRAQQKVAVERILNLKDSARQQKMVDVVATNAFVVLEDCQVRLREAGYIPGMDFPTDTLLQEALAMTIENTAFVGEILLYLPDITHKLLLQNKSWHLLFTWGIFFATQSKFLDKKTNQFFHLVAQELGVAELDPDYTNPYSRHSSKQAPAGSGTQMSSSKEKKRKSFKKGPQLSRQFGDL